VANFNDGASGGLSSFHVEPDGTLRHASTVDTKAVHPKGVAVTPDGKFVHVVHGTPRSTTPSDLVGYAVGRDGTLTGPVARVKIGVSGASCGDHPGRPVPVPHHAGGGRRR
jgi:hypothetical protein